MGKSSIVNSLLAGVDAELSLWAEVRDDPEMGPEQALDVLATWANLRRYPQQSVDRAAQDRLQQVVAQDIRRLVEQLVRLPFMHGCSEAVAELAESMEAAGSSDEREEAEMGIRGLFKLVDRCSLASYAARQLLPENDTSRGELDGLARGVEAAERYVCEHGSLFAPVVPLASASLAAYRSDLEQADPALFQTTHKYREIEEASRVAESASSGAVAERGDVRRRPDDGKTSTILPFRKSLALGLSALAAAVLLAVGIMLWIANGGRGGRLVAQLEDNGELIGITQDGELAGGKSLPHETRAAMMEMLSGQDFPSSSELSTIRTVRSETRGARDKADRRTFAALVEPIHTAVRSDRPTFRWRRPREAADSYFVSIFSVSDEEGEPVEKSQSLAQTEWTPTTALRRGTVYFWQVTAVRDGQQQTAPKPGDPLPALKILDAEKLSQVEQAERELRRSHLALAALYAEAGLLDEAERELNAVRAENTDSDLAEKLLESLDKLRFNVE